MNLLFSCDFNWRQHRWVGCLLSLLVAFFVEPVLGQGQFAIRNYADTARITWVSGPDNARLGVVGRIAIPPGYRWVDKEGAQAILERTGNPAPEGLVGILAPESGQWWAVVEFTSVGYIKDADKQTLDPAAILQAMQKRNDRENSDRVAQGGAPILSVDWRQQPSYDAATHSLAWAVRAETRSGKTVNDTVLLFGRTGVLEVTAVQPYQTETDLPPLKDLVKNVTFKEDQRYADYQIGDKVASISLLGLIVDDQHPAASNASTAASGPRFGRSAYYALAGGAGGIVLVGAVVLLARRSRRTRRSTSSRFAASEASLARSPDSASGSMAVKSNGNGNGNGHNGHNGHNNGSKRSESESRGRGRRKMSFDYARFYTDFVMTTHLAMSNGIEPQSKSNGRENMVSNGHSNGGHDMKPPQPAPNPQAVTVNLVDMIANQNALIEEQRRLIQEQTRLIEEKNKFIKGQNEFLELQSAAFESQYSLKLE